MADFVTKQRELAEKEISTGKADPSKKGKGGLTDLSHGRAGDTLRLNPYTVQVRDGWNIRDDADPRNHAHMVNLAKDIAKNGQKDPINVCWDKQQKCIFVIDGHTRLRAVRYANEHLGAQIEYILARTSGVPENEADQMAKTFMPGSLTPTLLEMAAQARKMMMRCNMTVDQVADRIGKEAITVKNWIEWEAALTPDIRMFVVSGKISLSGAYKLIKECDFNTDEAHKVMVSADQEVAQDTSKRVKKLTPARLKSAGQPKPRDVLRSCLGYDTGTAVEYDNNGLTVSLTDEQAQAFFKLLGIKTVSPNIG